MKPRSPFLFAGWCSLVLIATNHAANAAPPKSEGPQVTSEQAIERGLKWLVAHQLEDGGWHFDHGLAPQHVGTVNHPGKNTSRTGATGAVLLALLYSGQTHLDGEHKVAVRRGLHFLGGQGTAQDGKLDLRGKGGDLLCHALATWALTESYALTQDKALPTAAEQAIAYLEQARDVPTAGWGRQPGQRAEMSATGFQLLALKSAHGAYLKVSKESVQGAISFLDRVQVDDGAAYGCIRPERDSRATATGLLLRAFLGWKRSEPALKRGLVWLQDQPPTPDSYETYYRIQLATALESSELPKLRDWKQQLERQLIAQQQEQGNFMHERGSWTPRASFDGLPDGRMMETALGVISLATARYRVWALPDLNHDDDF